MSSANKLLQAASGGAGDPVYVEDVFSTDLWDGDGSSETVTNGIDFSGEGGLAWIKRRSTSGDHVLIDTVRGGNKALFSSSTSAEYENAQMVTAFNSNGFALGSYLGVNENNEDLVGWSFRKQPGFFDVVTYTGNGTAGRTVSHNLNSVPGMIIVKRTDSTNGWPVYHRAMDSSSPQNYVARLNATDARFSATRWNNTAPTSTVFTLGDNDEVNGSGATYVAYLFAHDDQQFGDDGDEAIIKCGSYTGNGNVAGPLVDVGFEPQFVMVKAASRTGHWFLLDVMRGIITGPSDSSPGSNEYLLANSNGAEGTTTSININPTGFQPRTSDDSVNENSATYIYMAIRRPMKTPEYGTEVFNGVLTYSDSSTTTGFPVDIGFPVDLSFVYYTGLAAGSILMTRLTGLTANPQPGQGRLLPYTTSATGNSGESWAGDSMTGYRIYGHAYQRICYGFKRAPGFFDISTFTFTGATTTFNHNLTVPPEFIITREFNKVYDWYAWGSALGANKYIILNSNAAATSYTFDTAVTATTFKGAISSSNEKTVAFHFATLAGVSKVGTYSGTGSDVNVDCGFSAGARFILIKRTDDTGDWYVYDSVRGIVAGNDPYFLVNSTAVQVSNTDYIDPLNAGFTVTSSAPAALNASGGTYLFIAIA